MSDSKRIAKNTLMLYFRQILIMLVSLYTVRVVLNVLGAEDYGIYNVVAGVVTMFSFLSGAMATASQRYFSFDLGKNDKEHLKITFSITFQIYLLLSIFIIVVAETIGVWFVNNKLLIPEERIIAANWIFQVAILSFLLTLITTPYKACLIAHENMDVYAYVSIVEVVLKLIIVFLLKVLIYDKLILYGFLLGVVSLIVTTIYRVYCCIHYEECKFKIVIDKLLFKEIISYSSWNLFGALSSVIRKQGMTIIVNLFFNPVIVAAQAVTTQINSAVISFSQNFTTALRPQIIKSYAANERDEMLQIMFFGLKIVYFLMLLICVPLFFQCQYVLDMWLKQTPEYAYLFVRLMLIDVLIDSISYPMKSVVQAIGKIRLYQFTVGGCRILCLPIVFVLLKFGGSPETIYYVSIALSITAFLLRIFFLQKFLSLSLTKKFFKLILIFLLVTFLSSILPKFIILKLTDSFIKLQIFVLVTLTWICIIIALIGLNKQEKAIIIAKLKSFRRK